MKLHTIPLTFFIRLGLECVLDLKVHLVWLVLVGQIQCRLKKIEIQRHKDQPIKNRKIGKLTC